MIELLPDGSFHLYHLPQDDVAVLAITDVLFAGSHILFEIMKKSESAVLLVSSLSFHLLLFRWKKLSNFHWKSISASFWLCSFLLSSPKYRAVDAVHTTLTEKILLNNIDFRRRIATDPINLIVPSQFTLPTETRNEEKYNNTHQRTFLSTIALNYDRIIAEYTEPLNQELLTGRWYAPENVILITSPL